MKWLIKISNFLTLFDVNTITKMICFKCVSNLYVPKEMSIMSNSSKQETRTFSAEVKRRDRLRFTN